MTVAKESAECYVYLQMPGSTEVVTCGRYSYQRLGAREGIGTFVYGRRYLARPDAVPVDPYELPLSEAVEKTGRLEGVFGAIRDAAPDSWGNRVIERNLGRTDLTILDYLLNSPEDRAGALSFGLGVVPPAPVRDFNRIVQLPDLLAAAQQLESLASGDPTPAPLTTQLAMLLLTATSMGGARPKNVVEDSEGLWVAKFPAQGDRWNNAAVESALLALARRCGIRTPDTRIEHVDGQKVLLVKRFDRERIESTDGTPNYLRSRMVSALTVVRGEEIGVGTPEWSYVLLADELQRWSESPRDDKRELFRRMVFNALVSNLDDHPRNHALVAPRRQFRLSPAYDLTPSTDRSTESRALAMIGGLRGRAATRFNFLSQAQRFAFTADEASEVIDQMRAIVEAEWVNEVHRHGGTTADVNAIQHAFLYPGFEYTTNATS